MTVRLTTLTAAAFYVVASLAMTWPLALDCAHSLPADFGDPLLNSYILAWGEGHLTATLGGDLAAYGRWWQANIFYPAPYALAYSEHLFAEIVIALPVWLATGNVILSYNFVFLASYALSGLGAFLLVRELTGRPRAALVAGLCFAFVPYRISQMPHVQVLSSEWMPFTLYALRRYFDGGRPRALVGAISALVAQQLSCGYYLIYFTPFVAFYVIWEIAARRRWADRRLLVRLAVAAAVDVAIVYSFLAPYLTLRQLGFAPRSLREVASYSADVWAYFTTSPENRLWGPWLGSFRRSENDAFPGMVLFGAALTGVTVGAIARWRDTESRADSENWRRRTAMSSVVLFATGCASLAVIVLVGPVTVGAEGFRLLEAHDARPLAGLACCALATLLLVSRRARAMVATSTDLHVWAIITTGAALLLSLGPAPHSGGQPLSLTGPYLWLYEFVPGVDGLRVPARLAMIAYVGLTVLAGYGLAKLDRRAWGAIWMGALAVVVLLETTAAPIKLNVGMTPRGYAAPPSRVRPAREAPGVYRFLAGLPPGTVIAEFPFGSTAWEFQYVFYAAVHGHLLLNGHSGGTPRSYGRIARALSSPLNRPQPAWEYLVANHVSHVVLHRTAYLGSSQPMSDWLESNGAHRLATFGDDELYELPR
jgi:hypothetical protein